MTREHKKVILEMDDLESQYSFSASIVDAISSAEVELANLEETLDSINQIKPDCDKLDYALAASSGALCGIIDIFLVGRPGESSLGDFSDEWVANRVKDFAKQCGWDGESLSSALRCLEKKFEIPYDQIGGAAIKEILDLNPSSHHFKSLGHNPTLLGLFFSILDQFTNQSHFVSEGELIVLHDAVSSFKLQGKSIPAKVFCGFVNWLGHLISDVSGSSGSKGRGMGIPSPLFAWTNDIIAIKRVLNLPVSSFDQYICELALRVYKQGFDARYLVTQTIPIFVNEAIVRLLYVLRRLIRYLRSTGKNEISFDKFWLECEPFNNSTIKRMLTVAHGTFCMLDVSDALIRSFAVGGGAFNACEFFLRLNIVGIGRFGISLYGEAKRSVSACEAKSNVEPALREKSIVNEYLRGLHTLASIYDDKKLICFIGNFERSNMYIEAFEQSSNFARLREVEEDSILKTIEDIDNFFSGDQQ